MPISKCSISSKVLELLVNDQLKGKLKIKRKQHNTYTAIIKNIKLFNGFIIKNIVLLFLSIYLLILLIIHDHHHEAEATWCRFISKYCWMGC